MQTPAAEVEAALTALKQRIAVLEQALQSSARSEP
jgi:hypothetical protein